MALGGETVGEAYIRILADGSGLDRDIRKEWKRHEPEFDDAGRRSNAAYRKGFDENWKKRPMWAESVRSLREGRGRFEAVGTFLGDGVAKNLRKTMEKELGDKTLARRIFKNLSEEAQRTGNLGVFKKGLGKGLPAEIARAVQQIQAANTKIIQDTKRMESERRRLADTTEKEFEKLLLRRSQILERNGLKDSDAEIARLRSRVTRSVEELRKGDKESSIILRRLLSNFNDHAERDLVKTTGFFNRTNREMTRTEQRARRMNKEFDKFASTVGKAFGAGARNNFFNALGKSVEGVTRLVTGGIPRIIGTLGELGSEFRLAGRRTDEFGNKISVSRRILNVLDTALQNTDQFLSFLTKGILSAVGGFGAFFVIAAPLASALSSLAAVVVALSGAIAFGLAGAIGALLPILGALAAAAAVVGIAFAGLDKKQKDLLKSRLKPLVDDFKQLRDATRTALFSDLGKQVPLASKLMKSLVPIFQGVGKALAQSFTGFLKMLDSPAFKKNFDSMKKFFPEAVTKLGHIFTNVFSGMSSVLRALVPFANKLLDALTKSTDRFAKFANSARGQNRIKDFMDRAWESAVKLWHTFRDLGRVLGDLFSAGRGPGNSLLDGINSSLERFDRFLKSPKGKQALAGWFADMKTFLHALGDLLKGVGKLFAALDSPQGHKILNALLSGLGKLFKTVADMIPSFLKLAQTVLPAVAGAFKILLSFVKPIFDFLSQHKTTAKIVALSIIALTLALKGLLLAAKVNLLLTPLFAGIGSLGTRLAGSTLGTQIGVWALNARGAIGRATSGINSSALKLGTAVAGIGIALGGIAAGRSMGGTKGRITGALSGAAGGALAGSVFGPWGAAIGGISGGLLGLAASWGNNGDKAKAAGQKAALAMAAVRQEVESLGAAIDADGNKFGAMTKAAVAASLQKSGALDRAGALNIDPELVVKAAEGNAAALKQVAAAARLAPTAKLREMGTLLLDTLAELNPRLTTAALESDQVAAAAGRLNLAGRSVAQQFQVVGGAFDKNNLSLNRNTKAGRDNIKFINDHLVALGQQVAKGKLTTNGYYAQTYALQKQLEKYGFGTQAIGKYIGALSKIPPSVLTKLLKTGVTPDQIQAIISKYGKIPPKLLTELTKTGVTPGQIQAILDKYFAIPPKRNTNVTAKDYASGVLNKIIGQIKYINGTTAYINVVNKNGNIGGPIKVAAAGKILNGATRLLAGEAGREAIVPLERPLNQVDPSVRALSAFAQGLDYNGQQKMASGGIVGGGKSVVVEKGAIALYAPVTDPHAAAQLILDGIATKGGYG